MIRVSRPSKIFFLALLSLVIPSFAFAFGPCKNAWPTGVSYVPSLAQCGGKSAAIMYGNFINSFSVVVRACDNGDRDPCYKNINACATNASSPFKVQKTMPARIEVRGRVLPAKIFCFKEAGNSEIYKAVRRMTSKRVDPVRNPETDVFKLCLNSRTAVRNPVTLISVGKASGVGNTGYNAQCRTQQYLGCNIPAVIKKVCPTR